MIVVLIAGGSGTRLWPLSTSEYPKHLLALTNERSLLQNTFDRVSELTSLDKILVISEKSHIDHVYHQLPELSKENILVEPARRGTASCVAWAFVEIKKKNLPNEPVYILWADHLIRDKDGFVATSLRAAEVADEKNTVAFIGVEPTYPSTGFGYMKKGKSINGWRGVYTLDSFVEKPDKHTAEEYFNSGNYLWNAGYFVVKPSVFLEQLQKNCPDMLQRYTTLADAKSTQDAYLKLENVAVDYVFHEKVQNTAVIPGTFDWADVGSFKDLHAISIQDDDGNHIKGKDVHLEATTNSYVRNDDGRPVAVIGLDNVVVVNTSSGVLVTNQTYAQKVGDVAKKIQK